MSEFNDGWYWVLNVGLLPPTAKYENLKVYPAKIHYSECEECGKKSLWTNPYEFKNFINIQHLADDAIIFVRPIEWKSRSGRSWMSCPGFFTKKKDLKIITAPKWFGANTVMPPYPACVSVDVTYSAIFTENPLYLEIPTIKTTCFECLIEKLPEPDYAQGNLRIWRIKDNDETFKVFKRKVNSYLGENSSKIYNHEIIGADITVRDGNKGYINSNYVFKIISPDHEELTLDAGEYILYHPYPKVGNSD